MQALVLRKREREREEKRGGSTSKRWRGVTG